MRQATKLKISRVKGMVDAQSTSTVTKFVNTQQEAIVSFINEIESEIEDEDNHLDIAVEDNEACAALSEAASDLMAIDVTYSPDDFQQALTIVSELLSDARS